MTTRRTPPPPALRVAIRVRPGASRPGVGGAYGPDGVLVVAVAEPAVDGRATRAALRAVADALGVRPRQVTLVHGEASRDKLVQVAEPPPDIELRLARLRGAPSGPPPIAP